ncbi:MAG: tetratricopeptide repeat protein, partial [bacterium]
MKKASPWLLIGFLALAQAGWINPLRDRVEEANKIYAEGKYEEAVQQYTDIAATYAPESPELHFNIGNAWFRAGDYEKAIAEYQKVAGAPDEKLEAKAHYGIGNACYRMEDYAKAIESYIQSLRLNPDDEDAKYNLELARRKLKEQIDQNKNQQQQQN